MSCRNSSDLHLKLIRDGGYAEALGSSHRWASLLFFIIVSSCEITSINIKSSVSFWISSGNPAVHVIFIMLEKLILLLLLMNESWLFLSCWCKYQLQSDSILLPENISEENFIKTAVWYYFLCCCYNKNQIEWTEWLLCLFKL